MRLLDTLFRARRVYVIAELGINANGDVVQAKRLIDAAAAAGADAVKVQVRYLPAVFTDEEMARVRPGPWGNTNGDLKRLLEFSSHDLRRLRDFAVGLGLEFSASPWDVQSVDVLRALGVPWIKIPSPRIGHMAMLDAAVETELPIILSTGMSGLDEVQAAINRVGPSLAAVLHCVSEYPARTWRLERMREIAALPHHMAPAARWGYSGHELGTAHTLTAVALGARVVERHLTLDRNLWGSDQRASMEPFEFARLVREIRSVEGDVFDSDNPRAVHPCELEARKKMWRTEDLVTP